MVVVRRRNERQDAGGLGLAAQAVDDDQVRLVEPSVMIVMKIIIKGFRRRRRRRR